MDYHPNGSILQYFKRKGRNLREYDFYRIIKQLVDLLQFLQDNDLKCSYSDINLENVLVTPTDLIVVADFKLFQTRNASKVIDKELLCINDIFTKIQFRNSSKWLQDLVSIKYSNISDINKHEWMQFYQQYPVGVTLSYLSDKIPELS